MASLAHSSLAHRERIALCDTFTVVGPASPTLCAPWTTQDLAAHLVMRERSPAAVGLAVSALSEWAERTQRAVAGRPFVDLVATIRGGPPRWSPMRLGALDAIANTFEYFVHHEDVRRAAPGWSPRDLPDEDQSALQHVLAQRAALFLRRAKHTVVLDAGDFGTVSVGDGPTVTLTAAPAELVLYLHGRSSVAHVEITGDDREVSDFRQLRLRI